MWILTINVKICYAGSLFFVNHTKNGSPHEKTMLFNSYVFIFVFFPIVFFGFFRIGKYSHALASLWLAAASLFFYGWWDIRFVSLLLGSIVFNYAAGYLIGHRVARTSVSQSVSQKCCWPGRLVSI